MELSSNELSERLSRLEHQQARLQRSYRRLRMMTGAMLLFCGAMVIMAQSNPQIDDSLDARQFVLLAMHGGLSVGSSAASRVAPAAVDIPASQTPGLAFYNQDGKPWKVSKAQLLCGPEWPFVYSRCTTDGNPG